MELLNQKLGVNDYLTIYFSRNETSSYRALLYPIIFILFELKSDLSVLKMSLKHRICLN